MCPERVQLLLSDLCCILVLSMTFLQQFFPGISGGYYVCIYLNWKRLSWFLSHYFQKVAGKTEKTASKHECRRIMKRKKGKKYCHEIYSGKRIKSRFQVSVFFDLFNLSNLSVGKRNSAVTLNPQAQCYSFSMDTHRSPRSHPYDFVRLQKGAY